MNNLEPEYFFDLSNYAHKALFERCTYAWQALAKIESYLEKFNFEKKFKPPKGVHVEKEDRIYIGDDTIIEPGSFIRGPCIIGSGCTIRHGAYIRGNFIAGDNCVIGHGTEVKNSIFLNEAHAAHFAYVGDSILGNHVNLGAGTVCANLKFDDSPIILVVEGSKVITGLRKLGAILGDGSQTGCNSVTNPGTLFGKQVFCYPTVNVGGFIPANRVIRSTEKMVVSSIPEPAKRS